MQGRSQRRTTTPRRAQRAPPLRPLGRRVRPRAYSFADDGTILASPQLSETARTALGLSGAPPMTGLRDAHRANLALHRTRNGFGKLRGSVGGTNSQARLLSPCQ